MVGFSIDYNVTGTILDLMGTASGNIRDELTTLEGAIKNNLNEENWVQQTKDVYTVVQARWSKDCDALNMVLGKARQVLGDIMTNYQVTDRSNAASFNQIGI